MKTWTEEELACMRAMVSAGIAPREITGRFSYRSVQAVRRKVQRTRLALGIVVPDNVSQSNKRLPSRVQQDLAFQAAMTLAIENKLENPSIGIVTVDDSEDFRPIKLVPELRHSGCTSSALACLL